MAGQVPVDALSEDMAKLGLEKAAVEKLLAFLQVESGWVGACTLHMYAHNLHAHMYTNNFQMRMYQTDIHSFVHTTYIHSYS